MKDFYTGSENESMMTRPEWRLSFSLTLCAISVFSVPAVVSLACDKLTTETQRAQRCGTEA